MMKRLNRKLSIAALLLSCSVYAQTPDAGFGTSGKVISPSEDAVKAMARQSDQKIIATGNNGGLSTSMQSHFRTCRYNTDGTPDVSFNGQGFVVTEIGFSSFPEAVAVQGDGKILVAGNYTTGDFVPGFHPALVRYNTDGTLDAGFANNGVLADEVRFTEEMRDMVLQPDGKIIIGGQVSGLDNGPATQFMLIRYHANGTRDSSFGEAGVVITPIGPFAAIEDIALQPDGKIIAAGVQGIHDPNGGMYTRYALARYTGSGELDTYFGNNGIVTTDVVPEASDRIQAMELLPDGKILAAGAWFDRHTLVRYTTDGTIDMSFGTNGRIIREMPGGALSLLIRNDGRFICGVQLSDGENDLDFVMHGYEANGAVDNTFGNQGTLITNVGDDYPNSNDILRCLMLQEDGKLLAGGSSSGRAALVRYDFDEPNAVKGPQSPEWDIVAYPNPVGNQLFISVSHAAGQLSASLYDQLGRNMLNNTISLRAGLNTLNLPALSDGHYLLAIRDARGNSKNIWLSRK
jgi:uncharacterized delta-60 repeat protein